MEERTGALERLLVCYRMGTAPSEALHRELERTRDALAARVAPGAQT